MTSEAPAAENVTQFPDRASRAWAQHVQGPVRGFYASRGVDDATLDHLMEALREIYVRDGDGLRVGPNATREEGMAIIYGYIASLTWRLLIEIADRELELIRLGARS